MKSKPQSCELFLSFFSFQFCDSVSALERFSLRVFSRNQRGARILAPNVRGYLFASCSFHPLVLLGALYLSVSCSLAHVAHNFIFYSFIPSIIISMMCVCGRGACLHVLRGGGTGCAPPLFWFPPSYNILQIFPIVFACSFWVWMQNGGVFTNQQLVVPSLDPNKLHTNASFYVKLHTN